MISFRRSSERRNLYVITIAGEKGGIGKTTIATNLAVYLKAIHEDIPVTIASFDNHFTVDQMYSNGQDSLLDINDLLGNRHQGPISTLGQYGVQYIASCKQLSTPALPPTSLRRRLLDLNIEGILILDTKPTMDWHTEASLLASDLVITPIKDLAGLRNVESISHVLNRIGQGKRLWLLPSLVDVRAKVNTELNLHQFLVAVAKEQNYQVLDLAINKSPKVESLVSGSSERVYPVLIKARNTIVNQQFKQLAEWVFADYSSYLKRYPDISAHQSNKLVLDLPNERSHRLLRNCPACMQNSMDYQGHYFYDMRTQRKGLFHHECLKKEMEKFDPNNSFLKNHLMVVGFSGSGMSDVNAKLNFHYFNRKGHLTTTEKVDVPKGSHFPQIIANITGSDKNSLWREFSLLKTEPVSIKDQLDDCLYYEFSKLRKKIWQELCESVLQT